MVRGNGPGADVFPGIAKVADRLIVLIDPAGLLVDLGVAEIAEAA
jgi:hypothetical protein